MDDRTNWMEKLVTTKLIYKLSSYYMTMTVILVILTMQVIWLL